MRDLLTFPAFRDAEIALMDIDEERLGYKAGRRQDCRGGQLPGQGVGHHRPRGGPQGRRRRPVNHPAGRRTSLPHRHRDPQEVWRGHQCRRHARPVGHLPRPAHDPGDARHRARHRALLPRRHLCSTTPTRWRCSAALCRGDVKIYGPLPQRAGHRRDAGATGSAPR